MANPIDSIGGAVSDLFAAKAFKYKAAGAEFEKKNYDLAAGLADQNAQFTETSTSIKETQQRRQEYQVLGGQKADVAGAGFEASGSALDLLRDSASQSALQRAVLVEQGQITEAGYKEQAESYRNMSSAADIAIQAANEAATGAKISAGFKFASAVFSLGTMAGGGGGGGGGGGASPDGT